MAPPRLPDLPTELIYLIAGHLPRPCHLSALARTNQRLYCIINNILYTQAVKPGIDPQPLLWATRHGVPSTADKAICAGAKPDYLFEFVLSRKAWELVCILERAAAPNQNSDDWDWFATPNANYGNPATSELYRDLHDIIGTMRSPWDIRPNPPPLVGPGATNPLLGIFDNENPDDEEDHDGSDTEPLSEPDAPLPFPPPAGGGLVGAFLGNLFQAVANHNHNPFNDDDDEDDHEDDDDLMDEDSEVEEWVTNIRSRGITRRCAPIHIAAKEGHNAVIEKLLEHGANIHLEAEWYCSCRPPLSLWETRELEAAGTLRENLEASYWPAIHLAMCFSRFDTAKFLIERGALTNIPKGHLGFTVLHQAASIGNLEMLKYIVEAGKATWPTVDVEDDMGLTPLYFACAKGHWDTVVPYLIEKGANIDKEFEVDLWEFKAKTTVLGEACYLGHYDRAMKLIELGADVKQQLEFNQLTFGRRHRLDEADDQDEEVGHGIKRIPLLHVCCTSPRPKDDDGYYSHPPRSTGLRLPRNEEPTALERVALIKRLLLAGTPIDQTWDDGNGETPLFMAAQFHVTSAVRALLKAGANPLVQDKNGRNALMAALHHPLGEEPWTTFAECFPSSTRPDKAPEIVRLLLEAGVPVNHRDSQGRTALHFVFRPRRAYELGTATEALCSIVRLLFDAGIDPCIRDKDHNPVMKNALKWDYGRAADLLVQFHGPTIGSHLSAREFRKYYLMMAETPSTRLYTTPYISSESTCSYDLLLDIDSSHYLTSDKTLLFDLIRKGADNNIPFLTAADKLVKRGLHRMNLTLEEKIRLIRKSIDNDMQRVLIEAVNITVHDSDPSVLRDKAVLEEALLQILRNPRRLSFSEPMIAHLINAGADLHRPPPFQPAQKSCESGSGTSTPASVFDSTATPSTYMPPLYTAIRYGHVKVVKYMLTKQPIRGNPHAPFNPYLHQAVNLDPAVKEKWPISNQQDEAKVRSDMVRALMESGADPTLLNRSYDTALSMLLKGLVADADRKMLKSLGHLIKPLSRGVDINVRNKEGKTVVEYLRELMVLKEVEEQDKDGPSNSEAKMKVKRYNEGVKLLRGRLELVPEEGKEGEGEKKEEGTHGRMAIKWLVPKGGSAAGRIPLCPMPTSAATARARDSVIVSAF
ncbi:ankyrin repeat-containing domain protein [Pseudoneurospora amorphoporcata]|uniref:Ankyrin repeat-containing domain protein n=1 Tax=Pseudoneurospora amorphoporcata TaxID=241081 RepID=A0AAN6NQW5_9PEZI|nr:ankyrin repeat-containing domain protein [Pseudoneurospora amorphoporcata]